MVQVNQVGLQRKLICDQFFESQRMSLFQSCAANVPGALGVGAHWSEFMRMILTEKSRPIPQHGRSFCVVTNCLDAFHEFAFLYR